MKKKTLEALKTQQIDLLIPKNMLSNIKGGDYMSVDGDRLDL